MFCTKCGADVAPGTMFCTKCGNPVADAAPVENVAPIENVAPAEYEAPAYAPASEEPAAPKASGKIDVNAVKDQLVETVKPVTNAFKSFFSKKGARFGVIAGVAALLIIGIVCTIVFSGNGYVKVKQDVELFDEDGTVSIVVNGKVLKDTIDLPEQKDRDGKTETDEDGKTKYYDYDYTCSMDGKITAIFVSDYITIYDDEGWYVDSYTCGELYVLNGKKLNKVAEDVSSYSISVSGKGVTYTTRNEREKDSGFVTYTLNLYNAGNKKSTTLSDEAMGAGTLSPDGKSVVYYTGEHDKDKGVTDYAVMLYSGKKSTEIADYSSSDNKEINVIGLSNKGKYIYAVESESNDENNETERTMYCYNNKGKSTKLGECESSYSGTMNKDHTQILFYNEGETFIAEKNKPANRISKKEVYMICPVSSGYSDSTYPVSNLYNQVYRASSKDDFTYKYDAWLIKKGGKDYKLVDGAYSIRMDESGEYLYYTTKKDDLKCVKISANKNAKEKAVTIAEDVLSFEVTSDRKYVYYLNDDRELLCVNGEKGGKAKELCDEEVSEIALNCKDVLFYLVKDSDDKDGDVYATKNGSKGKLIEDDIEEIGITATRLVYAISGDDYFISTGSKKLTALDLG